MIKKCCGCGATLQIDDEGKIGYTKSLEMNYCMRCFRIQNYHDFKNAYIDIPKEDVLKKLNSLHGFAFFFIDFLNLHEEAINCFKSLNMPKILVISKSDIIPKSIYIEKIKSWLKNVHHIENKVIFLKKDSKTSTKKIREEIDKMNDKNIYFVGITNAGKSTMITSILETEKLIESKVTISELPNTTLDFIKFPLENGKILIDTPGLNYQSVVLKWQILKEANPKKEIKPITYQLKKEASLVLENKLRITLEKQGNITWFGSESIKLKKVYQKNTCLTDQNKIEYKTLKNVFIFMKGIGFFYVKESPKVTIYGIEKEYISLEPAFLGGNKYD